jgi:hypothetical protein
MAIQIWGLTAFLVGVSQIAPRDVPENAEMIEFGFLRAQTIFDVAQALAEGQLRKSHAQKLIQMRKGFGWIVSTGIAQRSDETYAAAENP